LSYSGIYEMASRKCRGPQHISFDDQGEVVGVVVSVVVGTLF
jgi:hypothetical protein